MIDTLLVRLGKLTERFAFLKNQKRSDFGLGVLLFEWNVFCVSRLIQILSDNMTLVRENKV